MPDEINLDDNYCGKLPLNETDKKCAPSKRYENGSCIALNVLIEMAEIYNKENPNNKIQLDNRLNTLNPGKYKCYLVYKFSKILKDKCNNQLCWTKQTFAKKIKQREELETNTFRPDGPNGKFEWLNTVHIDDVMKQYESKYSDFKFLGAVPIDFDSLPELGIRDLNFYKLIEQGKTKLGIVFNLDKHNESGSHWCSMFADLKGGHVYFYDSYGERPTPEIRKLMRRIYHFCKDELKIGGGIIDHNTVRAQFKDFACGTYSMNFILRMLSGDSFATICNDKVPDDKINQCRKVYFNNDWVDA